MFHKYEKTNLHVSTRKKKKHNHHFRLDLCLYTRFLNFNAHHGNDVHDDDHDVHGYDDEIPKKKMLTQFAYP